MAAEAPAPQEPEAAAEPPAESAEAAPPAPAAPGDPAELFDLSWDPKERSDRSRFEPERRAALDRELRGIVAGSMLEAPDGEVPDLDPLQREAMRSLGYLE